MSNNKLKHRLTVRVKVEKYCEGEQEPYEVTERTIELPQSARRNANIAQRQEFLDKEGHSICH